MNNSPLTPLLKREGNNYIDTYTLITGATSGIGYEFARQFAAAGHNLIVASRNLKKMNEIKKQFAKHYQVKIVCFKIDLAVYNSAEKLFQFCQKNKYPVDILVNNSGIGLKPGLHVERPLRDINSQLNVNLISLTHLCQLFGQEMKNRQQGYILNVASTAAFQPMPFSAIYGAGKSFVLLLSEAMAIELKPFNVGVTAVCPGITDTNFFKYGKPRVPGWLYKLISPEIVVRLSIKAMYQRKSHIIPYFQHWLIAQVSRFLTRAATARLMEVIEKKRKNFTSK